MARSEHSAGFVVYVDADTSHPAREFLLLDTGHYWDFAKGHVEQGEDDLTAARRELMEEAGVIDLDVLPGFSRTIEYYFRTKKDGLIHKSVIFFLGRAKAREAQVSHEHVGLGFFTAEGAMERLTYASAKQVLRDAISHLESEPTEGQ